MIQIHLANLVGVVNSRLQVHLVGHRRPAEVSKETHAAALSSLGLLSLGSPADDAALVGDRHFPALEIHIVGSAAPNSVAPAHARPETQDEQVQSTGQNNALNQDPSGDEVGREVAVEFLQDLLSGQQSPLEHFMGLLGEVLNVLGKARRILSEHFIVRR